jgi:hypothetical protein
MLGLRLSGMIPYSLVHGYRRFGGTCCPHCQGTNRVAVNICKTTLRDIPGDESALKIKAASSSETLVPTYQTTCRFILEDRPRKTNVLRYSVSAPFHLLPTFRPSEALVYKCGHPNKIIGFFSWPNPSHSIMALGSTQPVTEYFFLFFK